MTDNIISFRGSKTGHCSRSIAALALNFEAKQPDPSQQVIFGIGHALEPIGRDLARLIGYEVDDPQGPKDMEVILPGSDGWRIRGHLDGRARLNGDRLITEVKTMGHFAKYTDAVAQGVVKACPEYNDQSQSYMAADFTPETLFVLLDKDDPLYTLAAALRAGARVEGWTYDRVLQQIVRDSRVDFQIVEADQNRVAFIIEKHQRIAGHVKANELPPPDEGARCSWCDYQAICNPPANLEAGDLVLEVGDDPEAAELLKEYAAVYPTAKEYEKRLKALKERVNLFMGARGIKKLAGLNKEGLNRSMQPGRESLDQNKIPVEILAEARKRGNPFPQLRYSPPKEK